MPPRSPSIAMSPGQPPERQPHAQDRQAADHDQHDPDDEQDAPDLRAHRSAVEEAGLGDGAAAPAAGGAVRPRCSQPDGVSCRPRGVRASKPICIRYGSTTSSIVSIGSRDGRGHGGEADRAAAVVLGDGAQQLAVHRVQPAVVDLEQGERIGRERRR